MPKIVLEHVTKRFQKFTAVEDLNMVIEDREFIILLGPSGCGKTTTLRMIAGLETPTEGRITIGDTVVFDSEKKINHSPAKRDIGFLFQNYALWPHMTVHQNIAFGLENLKWPKAKIEERVKEMLQMLKIEEFDKRYPAELSGGQQQRVAIARTLAPKPKVLFMDEPLSNLDAKLRLEMRIELKRLHTDTDSTFIYVTHDQLEAMTLSSKICLIKNGYLQQFDPPMETYSNPANLFVADFVGNPSMNFIDAKCLSAKGKSAELEFFGRKFEFKSGKAIDGMSSDQVVVGVRPEFVHLETGDIKGKIYGTLPAGMETTVKLDIDGYIFTSVKFGSVDYKLNSDMNFSIEGDGIILFDKESGKNIGKGSVVAC
ncbi:MAG: ABC transporter ATP-binding protein [Spirochaetales bacterium]|nr:ABC transporter ATP-binding protein [Spirochaetales bacterium]